MKRILNFDQFSINEELKYPENFLNQMNQIWKNLKVKVDKKGVELSSDEEIIWSPYEMSAEDTRDWKLNNLCFDEQTNFKIPVTEIIYEGFNKKLGAIALEHLRTIHLKSGKELQDFDSKIQEAVKLKSIEKLPIKITECVISLGFRPFYSNDKKIWGEKPAPIGCMRLFSFVNYPNEKDKDFDLLKFDLYVNMFWNSNPIRHELQHLTQMFNNISIDFGDHLIKNPSFFKLGENYERNKYIEDKLISIDKLLQGSNKRWGGKIKTGWDVESGIIGTTTPEDFEKILGEIRGRGLKGDGLRNRLIYLGSDIEYKPNMYDAVDKYTDKWCDQNKYHFQQFRSEYAEKGEKALDDDVINNIASDIVDSSMNDPAVIIMKKVRGKIFLRDMWTAINKKLREMIKGKKGDV